MSCRNATSFMTDVVNLRDGLTFTSPSADEGWMRVMRLPNNAFSAIFTLFLTHAWSPGSPGDLFLVGSWCHTGAQVSYLKPLYNPRPGRSYTKARYVQEKDGYRYLELYKTETIGLGTRMDFLFSCNYESCKIIQPVMSAATEDMVVKEFNLSETTNTLNAMNQDYVIKQQMGGGYNSFCHRRLRYHRYAERRAAA